MATFFDPMPNLVNSEEDNFETASENVESTNIETCETYEEEPSCEELSVVTKTSSRTHYINWVIDNRSLHIAKLAPKGDKRGVIEANVEKDGHRFKLELCASGWRNSQDGYCAFYLTVADQDELFVARYRVQVGEITRISSIRHDFHLGVGFPNFCEQSTLESILTNNCLRFLVTVEVFNCESKVKKPTRPLSISNQQQPPLVMSRLMNHMFKERMHTDILLVCRRKEIPVHKCVLAHASPVFKAMFSHNLLERLSNEIHMQDFETSTIESMVRFLYTAKIDDPNDTKPQTPRISRFESPMNDEMLSEPEEMVNEALVTSIESNDASPLDSEDLEMEESGNMVRPDLCGRKNNTLSVSSSLSSVSRSIPLPSPSPSLSAMSSGTAALSAEMTMTSQYPSNLDTKMDSTTSVDKMLGNGVDNMNNNNNDINKFENNSLSKDSTFKLFQLAEMYKIESLVICCCQKMHEQLTINTSCELLTRIERYSHVVEIKAIKESIWEFMTDAENIRQIKKTAGYGKLVRHHPDLLGQLIDQMTK